MTTTEILDGLADDIERLRMAGDLLTAVDSDPLVQNVGESLRKRADIMASRLSMLSADSAQIDPNT